MITVFLILAIAALILNILSATNRIPLWYVVLILCTIELLRALPLGK